MESMMTCTLAVNTRYVRWDKAMKKLLKGIDDVSYFVEVQTGIARVSGRIDQCSFLKNLQKVHKHVKIISICYAFGIVGMTNNRHFAYPYPVTGYHNSADYYYGENDLHGHPYNTGSEDPHVLGYPYNTVADDPPVHVRGYPYNTDADDPPVLVHGYPYHTGADDPPVQVHGYPDNTGAEDPPAHLSSPSQTVQPLTGSPRAVQAPPFSPPPTPATNSLERLGEKKLKIE